MKKDRIQTNLRLPSELHKIYEDLHHATGASKNMLFITALLRHAKLAKQKEIRKIYEKHCWVEYCGCYCDDNCQAHVELKRLGG